MTTRDELRTEVKAIVEGAWEDVINARVVPIAEDLGFGNKGKNVDATFLYADLSASTKMVDELLPERAAEVYKAFLLCASKLIRKNAGTIQAYDGDRVLGVFLGADKEKQAVLAALSLHFAVDSIVNPEFRELWGDEAPQAAFTVGIDTGRCLVVKVGVRGAGELAWIGPAANYAAKLNSFPALDHSYPIRATTRTIVALPEWLRTSLEGEVWDGPFAAFNRMCRYRRTRFWLEFD